MQENIPSGWRTIRFTNSTVTPISNTAVTAISSTVFPDRLDQAAP